MNHLPAIAVRAALLLLAALLPAVLLPPALPARPDVVLLVVVAVALLHGPGTGALVGLAGGWLVDLVPPGGEPLGAGALLYLAAGALAGVARRYATWSPLLYLAATLAAALVVQGVRGVVAAAGIGVAHPVDLLWSVAMTVLFGIVLVPLLVSLERGLIERGWA